MILFKIYHKKPMGKLSIGFFFDYLNLDVIHNHEVK